MLDACVSERHALLLVPETGRAKALAVELHGSGLDVRRQRSISKLSDLLLAQGIAVLLPQGGTPFQLMAELEPGFAWNIPGAHLPGRSQPEESLHDDLGWIDDLVQATREDLGFTREPLFLAGYSGGARLASHLLVKGRSHWTAAGLVAGLRAIDGNRAPPPTLSFHGLDDLVNPYGGSDESRWNIGVEEAGDLYAAAQGCLSGFREEAVPSGWRRVYSKSGREMLELHALAGAAHTWPGSTDAGHLRIFGPATTTAGASAMIASFFIRHLAAQEV